ncbi:MAG TPA: hypothetical protein VET23_02665 [Chitinophagaceae bacterium]|nr:hypothetical protein [Chitinophagaceae bacterium]
MFLHPHVPTPRADDGILYHALVLYLQRIGKSPHLLFPLLAFGLLFIQSVSLARIINNRRMLTMPGYLPGMSYMLITSLFPEWNFFSAPLLTNTLLIYIISVLLKIYNQQKARGTIFNIGLALGIAGFLLFSSLTFAIWIMLALVIMRPFQLTEWLLCILGIITPYYFYGIYLFLSNQWSWHRMIPVFSVSVPAVKQSAWVAGSAFLLLVPFLTGGYYIQDNLRKMLIQVRKGWSLFLLSLLAASFVPFVTNNNSLENWVMAVVSLAAFHSCGYLYSKIKIFPLILFWLSVGFILAYQYYGPGW